MPYYHVKCGGKIHLWRRKCTKCKKRWPLTALLNYPFPSDMHYLIDTKVIPDVKKGKTSYAKWSEKVPGASTLASWLPNWPRWVRILAFTMFIFILGSIIYLIAGGLSN